MTDTYPPLIGGATRSAALVARELANRGHRVAVATTWQPAAPAEAHEDGVSVHRLQGLTLRMPWLSANVRRRIAPPFPDPETVLRFHRLVKRFQPDLVHSYGWLSYSCALALARKNVPLLLSARDYGNVCAVRTLVRQGKRERGRRCDGPAPLKCLECARGYYGLPKAALTVGGVLGGRPLLRRRAGGMHSVSTHVRRVVDRHLLSAQSTSPIPHEVLPDFRVEDTGEAPDSAIMGALPDTPFILFVGALRSVKGLAPLLAAYEELRSPPPLVLMGTPGPETPTELPRGVTVLHDVPHATVMAAWERAMFGVAPSLLAEPLGNVVHEAMSRGKAVIGTAPSGMEDMIVDGETGYLLPPGDVAGLTAAMQRLLDDRQLRERLGCAGRTHAGRFTAESVIPRLEELYLRVVAAHRGEVALSRSHR